MTRIELYTIAIAMLAIGAIAGYAHGQVSMVGKQIKCEITTAMPPKPDVKGE
jgi:hypothetical protein